MPAINAGGQKRLLALIPSDPASLKTFPRFSDKFQVLPRSEWKPVSRRKQFPWILDQGQYGSCTDHAGCYAHRKTRVLRGMSDVELSATFGYAQVNRGRDQGAQVSDILGVMRDIGRCLMSECPESVIYKGRIPKSAYDTAGRFRVTDAFTLSTFDELATAVQLDIIPALAIQVGDNFNSFDSDGAAGFSQGPGNHAVHVDGLFQTSQGRWLLDMPNSWGSSWGDNGRAYLSEDHVNSVQQDSYGLVVALTDPNDQNQLPQAA